MKTLINIIQEKLIINKHSKIKENYYSISGKEFIDLVKIFNIKDDLKDLKLSEYNNRYINIYTHPQSDLDNDFCNNVAQLHHNFGFDDEMKISQKLYKTSDLFIDGIYLGGYYFYLIYTSEDHTCFAIQIYRNGGEPLLIIFATNNKDIEMLTNHLTKNKWTEIKDIKEVEKICDCFKI